jgi:hypothetical protein
MDKQEPARRKRIFAFSARLRPSILRHTKPAFCREETQNAQGRRLGWSPLLNASGRFEDEALLRLAKRQFQRFWLQAPARWV